MLAETPAWFAEDARCSGRPPRSPLLVAALAVTVGLASPAAAKPCADLPNPVYGMGSSTEQPLFSQIGRQLAQTPASTLVFQSPGACVAASCQACVSDASCPSTAPRCRHGYCEAY